MSDEYKIRVRVSAPDPFAGLIGHAYIEARGLSPRFLAERRHQCETCRQAELLPTVQNILENWEPTCTDS